MLPVDQLVAKINRFIRQPFPLWQNELTIQLVNSAYQKLESEGMEGRAGYHTSLALSGQDAVIAKQYLAAYGGNIIYLEEPDEFRLTGFYEEHGLIPLSKHQLINERVAAKLKAALALLALVPECINSIACLVNCIQVIASEGPNYDSSYSHPNLPFTIFVSVCEDDDTTSSLRVAEGILHEAMHLKLSLIQRHIELTNQETTETFYSPWREVQRPLMGVLHGLFVFRAIQEFFKIISTAAELESRASNFSRYRISDIDNDFSALKHFASCNGLTKDGAILSANLLPSN